MHSFAAIDNLRHLLELVLLAVGALFPVVDPLGGAPIYLAMTAGLTAQQRAATAKAVAINSFLLLILSALLGTYVLAFFGLSVPAVQVGGGILVCAIAWSLLNAPDPAYAPQRRSAVAREDLGQRAFYPLTLPLTVGPGSISVALTLGANPEHSVRAVFTTTVGNTFGATVIALLVYLCYRYADRILERIGPTGTSIIVRLSAFILLCIGAQIAWNGIHALLTTTFPDVAH